MLFYFIFDMPKTSQAKLLGFPLEISSDSFSQVLKTSTVGQFDPKTATRSR